MSLTAVSEWMLNNARPSGRWYQSCTSKAWSHHCCTQLGYRSQRSSHKDKRKKMFLRTEPNPFWLSKPLAVALWRHPQHLESTHLAICRWSLFIFVRSNCISTHSAWVCSNSLDWYLGTRLACIRVNYFQSTVRHLTLIIAIYHFKLKGNSLLNWEYQSHDNSKIF